MQDFLIYGGIGINVAGALFLMAYGMKYTYAFHKSKKDPIQTETMKPKWAKKKSHWIWLDNSRFYYHNHRLHHLTGKQLHAIETPHVYFKSSAVKINSYKISPFSLR